MSKTHQLTVAKIEESEVNELRTFLQDVGEKVKEFDQWEEDCLDANEEIGKMVRKTFPHRPAFIAPLNLHILLHNYQDKESDILAHPKWLIEMYELFEELDEYLSGNPKNYIGSGSILHQKIKKYVSEDDASKADAYQ
jgi:hypothetical protein